MIRTAPNTSAASRPDGWHFRVMSYEGLPPRFFDMRQYSYAPNFLGFQLYWSKGIKHLRIPYWFILLLLAITTLVVWRKTRPKPPGRGFPVIFDSSELQS